MNNSIFNRCGVGRLPDVAHPECLQTLSSMEKEQESFLAKQTQFRSRDYHWPHDALHSWSRIWEYPYVFHHLRQFQKDRDPGVRLEAADIGSGVTFFPLLVAKSGFRLTCIDMDPVVARDIPQAAEVLGVEGVAVITSDGSTLPLADASMDVVYCISVLEHIPQFESTIREMARILKPEGLLILTIDLDLNGNAEIGPGRYRDLLAALESSFELAFERTHVHPAELLTSSNSPYHLYPSGLRFLFMIFKQLLKPLLHRPVVPLWKQSGRIHLAVEGTVWRFRR